MNEMPLTRVQLGGSALWMWNVYPAEGNESGSYWRKHHPALVNTHAKKVISALARLSRSQIGQELVRNGMDEKLTLSFSFGPTPGVDVGYTLRTFDDSGTLLPTVVIDQNLSDDHMATAMASALRHHWHLVRGTMSTMDLFPLDYGVMHNALMADARAITLHCAYEMYLNGDSEAWEAMREGGMGNSAYAYDNFMAQNLKDQNLKGVISGPELARAGMAHLFREWFTNTDAMARSMEVALAYYAGQVQYFGSHNEDHVFATRKLGPEDMAKIGTLPDGSTYLKGLEPVADRWEHYSTPPMTAVGQDCLNYIRRRLGHTRRHSDPGPRAAAHTPGG